jgi:hypothetical protein
MRFTDCGDVYTRREVVSALADPCADDNTNLVETLHLSGRIKMLDDQILIGSRGGGQGPQTTSSNRPNLLGGMPQRRRELLIVRR